MTTLWRFHILCYSKTKLKTLVIFFSVLCKEKGWTILPQSFGKFRIFSYHMWGPSPKKKKHKDSSSEFLKTPRAD